MVTLMMQQRTQIKQDFISICSENVHSGPHDLKCKSVKESKPLVYGNHYSKIQLAAFYVNNSLYSLWINFLCEMFKLNSLT